MRIPVCYCYRLQVWSVAECAFADVYHVIAKSDILQRGAASESVLTDSVHVFRTVEAFQFDASPEAGVADGLEVVVGIYRFKLRTPLKGTHADVAQLGRTGE